MNGSPRTHFRVAIAALLAAPLLALAAPATSASAAPSVVAVHKASVSKKIQHKRRHAKKKATKKKATKKAAAKTTTVATSTARTVLPATTAANAALEDQVLTLVNRTRVQNGCGALRSDDRLRAAARAHSLDMVAYNNFSHTGHDGSTFVDRANRAGYTAASAENIAWGFSTADSVMTAWMNSPGHRTNILNCTSVATGIGVARKADGTVYWTEDFGRS
jgi:uncharacterized protein YkwD